MPAKPLALLSMAAESLVIAPDYRTVRNMPAQGKPVHKRGVITVPAAPVAGSPSTAVIAAFTVPPGFSFLLQYVLLQYMGDTAPDDFEGITSQMFYTLRVAGRYFVEDFETINTSLGSLDNGPYPIAGGFQFPAGTLVELVVNVPSGSTIATGGTNRVFGHLIGWIRPGGRDAGGANASEG